MKPCGHGEFIETVRHALAHKQLMDGCRHALHMLKQQNDFIQELTRQHPDIVQRVQAGDPEIATSPTELCRQKQ